MRRRCLLRATPVALAALALLWPDVVRAQGQQPPRKVPESLVAAAQSAGAARVIIRIARPQEGGRLEAFRVPERHITEVLGPSALAPARALGTPPGEAAPFVVAEVNADGLARLAADASVQKVYPDLPMYASLSDSIEIVEAMPVWKAGGTGKGVTVAVIDSGIRRDHPFLKGRIVAEACFSSTSDTVKARSLCPSGQDEEIGHGAARDCGPRDDPKGCGHGTHVAGIVAGANGRAKGHEAPLSGVAPGASIVAVKVFTRVDDPRCPGGQPFCMTAFSSDTLKGLLHIESVAETAKIRVVNMSLGGGRFDAACDEQSPLADVIGRLAARGIAVVIAAGNEKYVGAIAHPACLSAAIAVGATTKKGEIDARYSNVSDLVRIVAPGTEILSSLGAGFGKSSGTSMAAPHVAGLIALVKAEAPEMPVPQIVELLHKTGRPVTDGRVNRAFPLPSARAALAALQAGKAAPAPPAPPVPAQPAPPQPACGTICMETSQDRRRFIFALADTKADVAPDVLAALRGLFGAGAKVEPLGDGKLLVEVPAGASGRDIDDARRKLGGDGVRILPDRPMQPLEPGGRILIR